MEAGAVSSLLVKKVCGLFIIHKGHNGNLKHDAFVNLVHMFTVISGCSSLGAVLKCSFHYYSGRLGRSEDSNCCC